MKLADIPVSVNLVDTRFASSVHYKTEQVGTLLATHWALPLSTPDLLALALVVLCFVWVAVTYVTEPYVIRKEGDKYDTNCA